MTIRCELFVGGGWTDITGDVRHRDGVRIQRGRPDETYRPEPQSMHLTLDNRDGRYSPRNPTGPYHGSLGRNTPISLALEEAADTFGRTVTDGWGSADTGQGYTLYGSGGVPQDFDVAAGAGTMALSAAGTHRIAALESVVLRDVDLLATVSLPFTDVTGNSIFPLNLNARHQSVEHYLTAAVGISTGEAVSVGIYEYDSGFSALTGQVTVVGITHTASQKLRCRFHVEGETVLARVWVAGTPEPFTWHASGVTTLLAPGHVSVRSSVNTGNTNTYPIVCSIDDLSVRVPRFVGEVSSWPQRWDLSGADVHVPIEAAGIRRRLGQGRAPVASTFRRGYTAADSGLLKPVAYWPCEDGAGAAVIASGSGGTPMVPSKGAVEFASFAEWPSSAPLPTMKKATLTGVVPIHTGTGKIQLRFLLHVPSGGSGMVDGWPMMQVYTSTGLKWEVKYYTGGALNIEVWDWRTSVNYYDGPLWTFGLNGELNLCGLALTQNGADIDWRFDTLVLDDTSSSVISATLTGRTLGTAGLVVADQYSQHDGMVVGHIAVQTGTSTIFDSADELAAFAGDPAGDRILSTADQAGITLTSVGDPADTEPVGPKRVLPVLELIDEAAAVDAGSLYESRGAVGLAYRTRASIYNQAPALALDYAAGQLSDPFEPTDDDQLVRNDVTVSRVDGSAVRAELTSGRMSTLGPESGGAGRYDTALALLAHTDAQLADLAGWHLHLGTVDEPRYPAITVNLRNPYITAGLRSAALAVDIDDLITIGNPKPGQSPDLISQIVRGYTEYLDGVLHTLEFTCTPGSPYAVLRPGAAGKMHLGSASSTLAEDLTTTETDVDVAFIGSRWVTGAGLSIPIMIGGEAMTVTAITGTTSPQTFTVTRSVNGVVKTHLAGAPVRLARRATLAL